MEIKNFQNLCAETVEKIDKKYDIERNPHFSFTQLMEEIGELAKAINLPKLRNKQLDQNNLDEEFADVLLQLAVLAKIHNVDFRSAVKSKILELKKRHNIDIENIK
jgi:NTP pyrophosphatase (non-canonical NTP hydrolase)